MQLDKSEQLRARYADMDIQRLREQAKGFLLGRDVDEASRELGLMIFGRMNSLEIDGELTRKIGELVIEYLVCKYHQEKPN